MEQEKTLTNNGSKVLLLNGKGSNEQINFIQEQEKEATSFKLIYYIWISRMFIFFATLSLLFMFLTNLSLFRLAPLVEVEPFLIIRQDDSENLVRSEPIATDMSSKDLIFETFIKQYVILRNTWINDEQEMNSRWMPGGMVHFLSSWPIYSQFNAGVKDTIIAIKNNSQVREVEIISIGRLGGKKSEVWKVDFKTYDMMPNKTGESKGFVMKERYWTASVTARLYPERVFMGRRLINPLGFTVIRYSQSEVEIF